MGRFGIPITNDTVEMDWFRLQSPNRGAVKLVHGPVISRSYMQHMQFTLARRLESRRATWSSGP
jgi:hypothetical protein